LNIEADLRQVPANAGARTGTDIYREAIGMPGDCQGVPMFADHHF
jgi:hypothetical protein